MLTAQQRIIDLDPERQPLASVHDQGVVLYNRLVERLWRAEREAAVPTR